MLNIHLNSYLFWRVCLDINKATVLLKSFGHTGRPCLFVPDIIDLELKLLVAQLGADGEQCGQHFARKVWQIVDLKVGVH